LERNESIEDFFQENRNKKKKKEIYSSFSFLLHRSYSKPEYERRNDILATSSSSITAE
jgi:hypothetical protein